MPPPHTFHAPRRRLQPLLSSSIRPSISLLSQRLQTLSLASPSAAFTTTSPLKAMPRRRGRKGEVKDPRIGLIRYHLQHPLTPRPLRLSRHRFLRHWTIHRAWMLTQRVAAAARERELERMHNSQATACEVLRLLGEDGLAVAGAPARHTPEEVGDLGKAAARQKEVGRLYRIAMEKKGVWGGVPVEFAKGAMLMDFPSRTGWDHGWKRKMEGGR